MGIGLREGLRGLAVATLMAAGAAAGVACGGDDDNNTSSSGSSGTSSGSSGTSSGSSGTSSGSTGALPDAGPPDTGTPDSGPTKQAAAPTFTPAAGTYAAPQSVAIASTTPNATIYYTTDGTNPTIASVVYANPISVAATTTIRAMAVAAGFQSSAISSATYTIDIPPGTTAPVEFAPASGEYNNPVAVGLSTQTAPSTICYTIDGSNPTCNAGTCTGTAATYSAGSPIPVDAPTGGGALTVKALACSTGNDNSAVTTSTYTFKVATPTAAPGSGEVALDTNVTLQTGTAASGASTVSLRYNNSGSAPSCVLSDQTINGSAGNVRITKNTTYDVIGCRPNYQPSDVASLAYTVKLTTPSLSPPSGTFDNDVPVNAVNGGAPSPSDPAPAPPALPGTGTPATGVSCYAIGQDPVCNVAGTGCSTGSTTAPTVTGNDANDVRVRSCRPSFAQSDVAGATYTLKVARIAVTRTNGGDGPAPYDPLGSQNSWDPSNTGTASFSLDTGTSGETIRWTTNDAAPAPSCAAAFDCSPGNASSCSEAAAPAAVTGVAPFTTLRAVACKANYLESEPRTIVYADPSKTVTLTDNRPNGTYNNDFEITFTTTPADATVCYTSGTVTPADPTCNVVTGSCGVGSTTYNPAAKPTVSVTGTTVKAIACKSGVPNASAVVTHQYTMQVATPVFTNPPIDTQGPAGPTIGYNTLIGWRTATSGGITFRYNRGEPVAADPTCASGTVENTGVLFNNANGAPAEQFRVIACKTGYLGSTVATQTFNSTLPAPTISPNGNPAAPASPWYVNPQSVTLTSAGTSAPGGKICYTTNGGVPACNPDATCGGTGNVTQYAGAFTLNVDNTTVNAITCATAYPPSPLATAVFDFRVDPYTISPTPGPQSGAVNISFTNGGSNSTGPNTVICYSTNGADIGATCTAGGGVTCSGALSAGQTYAPAALQNVGVNINQLKSRACRAGFVPTEQRNDSYTFGPYSRTITIDGTDDFVEAENRLGVANNAENGELVDQRFYVSWDAENVYIGYRGNRLTLENDTYFHFYVRGSGTTTTTRDSLPGAPNAFGDNGSWNPVTGVNWHFYFRTDSGSVGVRQFSGGAWVFPVTAPDYSWAQGGTLGTASAFVEYRISRAALGLGATDSLILTGGIWDPSNVNDRVRFPSNNYDAPGAGNQAWDHKYLQAPMGDAKFPSFSGTATGGYVVTP